MLMEVRLRIGTWNMEGRWSFDHHHLPVWQQCAVWLLTEVSDKTRLPGYVIHPSRASIRKGVRWAAVAVTDKDEPAVHSDPHPASSMVTWSGVTFVASVLPWNSGAAAWPWPGADTAERTRIALEALAKGLSEGIVWGGDMTHSGHNG